MTTLLAIDPGILSPCGIAIFEDGRLIFHEAIKPGIGGPDDRIVRVKRAVQFFVETWRVDEIACELIQSFGPKRNLEGLVTLVRAIKHLAKQSKLPISFYTPSQWMGRHKRELVMKAIWQEWGLGADVSEHELAAIGIGAFHSNKQRVLRGGV